MIDLFGYEAEEHSKWNVLFSSKSDEWPTDPAVFADWNQREGPFVLDAASTPENAKCPRRCVDGLSDPWDGPTWCNPPYSDCEAWVTKALAETACGRCQKAVMLLPSRTDTRWFHLLLAAQDRCTIIFCRGRLRFGDAKSSAPFPSLVVVIRGQR